MPIKHILLPLAGLKDDSAVCQAALDLAKTLDAHVTAGFAEGDPIYYRVGVGIPAPGFEALQEAMLELTEERKVKARHAFDRAVAATKVPIVTKPLCGQSSTEWLDGWSSDNPITACGVLADLAVVTMPGENGLPEDWQIVEDLLFKARRPVLALPPGRSKALFSHAVIAWNGSAEASNAVRSAVDLLGDTSKITVLQVGQIRPGFIPSERLIDSLGWRCFAADVKQVGDAPHKTGQLILADAKALGATMLVMGAYTHSRTRERVLGGVTNYVLRYADIPVLLAH